MDTERLRLSYAVNLKPEDLVVGAPLIASQLRTIVVEAVPMLNDEGLRAVLAVSPEVPVGTSHRARGVRGAICSSCRFICWLGGS